MNTSYNRPDFLDRADKKIKELNEALKVIEKIDDQISWAQDFTSFPLISQALDPIFDSINEARETLEHELYYLEEKISDFNYKKLEFEIDNEIKV